MHIPKVVFREMTLEENIETIKWAYYQGNGSLSVHDYTVGYFPELSKYNENTPKEIVYNKIEEVVSKVYMNNLEKIRNDVNRYNDVWKKYNDKYFKLLVEYLGVDWPSIDIIEGKVGLIPVFPRYLDEFSFSVSTELDDWFLIKSCAHETLHFLWFEKWKQIHPEIPKREYDSPYISWKYSEMVTDPILNNKPFTDLFDGVFIEKGYDSFYDIFDTDGLIFMDNLRDIYSSDKPINDKIAEGFDYVCSVFGKSNSL